VGKRFFFSFNFFLQVLLTVIPISKWLSEYTQTHVTEIPKSKLYLELGFEFLLVN
jgi:hypothetical protein